MNNLPPHIQYLEYRRIGVSYTQSHLNYFIYGFIRFHSDLLYPVLFVSSKFTLSGFLRYLEYSNFGSNSKETGFKSDGRMSVLTFYSNLIFLNLFFLKLIETFSTISRVILAA